MSEYGFFLVIEVPWSRMCVRVFYYVVVGAVARLL